MRSLWLRPTRFERSQYMNPSLFDLMTGALVDEGTEGKTWFRPQMDVHETEKQFLFSIDLPGMTRKEIEVQVEAGHLKISGERKQSKTNAAQASHRVEKNYGPFVREFELPETADLENVEAQFLDGVLEITVPKKEAATPKRIEIKS